MRDNNKEIILDLYHWPFMLGIHRLPVDSAYIGGKCAHVMTSPRNYTDHGSLCQYMTDGINELTHCGIVKPYGVIKSRSTLAQVMACCLAVSSHNLDHCWYSLFHFLIRPLQTYSSEISIKRIYFHTRKWIWICFISSRIQCVNSVQLITCSPGFSSVPKIPSFLLPSTTPTQW